MKKEKKGWGFPSSQNTELCFLGRQYCFQSTVICNFAVSWASLSYQSQKTPSPEVSTRQPKSHRPPKVRSEPNERCQNIISDEWDRADIPWKLKGKGIIPGQKEEKYCDIWERRNWGKKVANHDGTTLRNTQSTGNVRPALHVHTFTSGDKPEYTTCHRANVTLNTSSLVSQSSFHFYNRVPTCHAGDAKLKTTRV